jgi:hypothetical protein
VRECQRDVARHIGRAQQLAPRQPQRKGVSGKVGSDTKGGGTMKNAKTLQDRDDMARNAAWYIQDAAESRQRLKHSQNLVVTLGCIIAGVTLCLAVSMAASIRLIMQGGV